MSFTPLAGIFEGALDNPRRKRMKKRMKKRRKKRARRHAKGLPPKQGAHGRRPGPRNRPPVGSPEFRRARAKMRPHPKQRGRVVRTSRVTRTSQDFAGITPAPMPGSWGVDTYGVARSNALNIVDEALNNPRRKRKGRRKAARRLLLPGVPVRAIVKGTKQIDKRLKKSRKKARRAIRKYRKAHGLS